MESVLRSRCMLVLLWGLLYLFSTCTVASGKHSGDFTNQVPLVFGLLPSESAVAKFKRYAPLREYLQSKLERPVVLETAKNFAEFSRRTRERKYDFLETAPHFVLPAVESGQYVVLTTIIEPLSIRIIAQKESAYDKIEDLANKKIATPSPGAIITRIGKEMFELAGLDGIREPVYLTYKTHNAAYEAVLGRQADAALISVNVFNKAIKSGKAIRSIGSSFSFPNMSIIAATDLPLSLRQKLQDVLVSMRNHTDGMRVLHEMSYPGYRKSEAKEFDALRKYINDKKI